MARLEAEGLAVYWLAVPDKLRWPYVLLSGGIGRRETVTVSGSRDHLRGTLRVTCVSKSALGVLDVSRRSQTALSNFRPVSDAWRVQPLALWDSMTDPSDEPQQDRDVTLPDTNQHPFYTVDLYQIIGEPMEV